MVNMHCNAPTLDITSQTKGKETSACTTTIHYRRLPISKELPGQWGNQINNIHNSIPSF